MDFDGLLEKFKSFQKTGKKPLTKEEYIDCSLWRDLDDELDHIISEE